jgi:hypothetical protein
MRHGDCKRRIDMGEGAHETCCSSKPGLGWWLAAALVAGVSCTSGGLGRGVPTSTTSAWLPRPDATGVSSRTIDNAGFVDNGGRTSDETIRAQTSGMRATEVGSERITGTPGSGQPIPFIEPNPPRRGAQRERAPDATDMGQTVAPTTAIGPRPDPTSAPPAATTIGPGPSPAQLDATERIARARCDRQTACDRIGPGRAWGSPEACMAQQRPRTSEEVASLACRAGLDGMQLGACLDAIRGLGCSESAASLDSVGECQPTSVCMP